MKILALDYGTKRIGVAISDFTETLARPLPFIPAESAKKVDQAIAALIAKEDVKLLLIGLPRNMDGTYGSAAEKVREFSARLQVQVTIPLQLVDERLSTVQASRLLQESGHDTRAQRTIIDSSSAAVFLQSFLDARAMRL